MTYEQLKQTVDDLSEQLGTKLCLYYIGNCSFPYHPERPQWYPGNYDDRSWGVSFEDLRDPVNRNHMAPHNLVLGPTQAWAEGMTADRLGAEIRNRFARLTAAAM